MNETRDDDLDEPVEPFPEEAPKPDVPQRDEESPKTEEAPE